MNVYIWYCIYYFYYINIWSSWCVCGVYIIMNMNAISWCRARRTNSNLVVLFFLPSSLHYLFGHFIFCAQFELVRFVCVLPFFQSLASTKLNIIVVIVYVICHPVLVWRLKTLFHFICWTLCYVSISDMFLLVFVWRSLQLHSITRLFYVGVGST